MDQFKVLGDGNIGEKARQLVEKTPNLIDIGFHVPHRTILAEHFFDPFFRRNRLGQTLQDVQVHEGLEEKVRLGAITSELFFPVLNIANQYYPAPTVIRSSAEGDARGTGIYRSKFAVDNDLSIINAFHDVLASYFSDDATLFRKDAGLSQGFAMILEPMIGQRLVRYFDGSYSDEFYAPIMSGFGYTSTSRGDGYVSAVIGLGAGVESADGERLTRSSLERSDGDLSEYLYNEFMRSISPFGRVSARRSSLLKTSDGYDCFYGHAFYPRTEIEEGNICRACFDFDDFPEDTKNGFYKLNMFPLFDMMDRMEETFKRPQYFEWAMTFEGSKPIYHIVQVADVNKKLDIFDFSDQENVLFTGHTVTGSGERICDKIILIWNPGEEELLYKLNKENDNYLLIYPSRLTSRGAANLLHYDHYSNASVFIEIQDALHANESPIGHLEGSIAESGKFFGVLDHDPVPDWARFDRRSEEIGGTTLKVYNSKVKVIASERQNKMTVSALD